MKKVALVANSSWYLYNFRLSFLEGLRAEGYELVLIAPEDSYSDRLRQAGFRLLCLPLDRKGMNPFRDLLAVIRLARAYRVECPDIAHHHTVKCVLYGSLAARLAGLTGDGPATVNSITGLGHLFLSRSPVVRAARAALLVLYRMVARWPRVHFLFQNPDDLAVFARLGVALPGRFTLVRGSGIDLRRFHPPAREREAGPVRVLFASRLLKEKGLYELRQAALLLRDRGVPCELVFAGGLDEGNPSSLTFAEIEAWQAEGWMRWLGHVEAMDDLLRSADICVLPSWREGLPRSLLEAAASGRAIVATDVPGCREVVDHGNTGLLVPVRSPEALADAIERLARDPALRGRLGAAARAAAVAEFSDERIRAATLSIYRALLSS